MTRSPIELFWTAKKAFYVNPICQHTFKIIQNLPQKFWAWSCNCHINFIICLSCPQPAQLKQVLQTTDCVCVAEEMSRVLSFEDAFICFEKESYLTWISRLAAFLNSFANQNSFKRYIFYESLNFLHGSDAEVIVNVFVFSHLLLRCRNNSDEHLVVRRRCCHYVACIAIALPWCTYCHIEHTGMLHPPPHNTPSPPS